MTNASIGGGVGTAKDVVQICGILFAAAWGVYEFLYKDIWVPRTAPAHLTPALAFNLIGAQETADGENLAVSLSIKCTNSGKRKLNLLPATWQTHGVVIKSAVGDTDGFRESVSSVFQKVQEIRGAEISDELHFDPASATLIAAGLVFTGDLSLEPSESVSRELLIHVPKGHYDYLEAALIVPTSTKPKKTAVEWSINQVGVMEPTVYRVARSGQRTELESTATPLGKQYEADSLEFNVFTSQTMLSLWEVGLAREMKPPSNQADSPDQNARLAPPRSDR